jgi:uncharacterized iron-regulated membrane protein
MSFQFFRRFFYEIHLWLGILCGIIVFLVCLSGAILVFRDDINRFADPGKYYVSVPQNGQRMPIDELVAKLESNNPGMKVASLTIPQQPNRTIVVSLSRPFTEGERGGFGERGTRGEGSTRQRGEGGTRPEGGFQQRGEGGTRPEGGFGQRGEGGQRPESGFQQRGEGGQRPEGGFQQRGGNAPAGGMAGRGGPGGGRGQGYFVNPYTGDIVAKPGDGVSFNRFFMSMQQFHRNLWISYRIERLGPRSSLGGLIVGTATLIFIVVVLSGLVLWLPRTWKSFVKWRAWKPGLIVRFRKGGWSFVHDIHNTVGFYCLIPMLILALTGLCWSFQWYRNAASKVLNETVLNRQRAPQTLKIQPVDENAKPLALEEMIQHLNALIPGPGEITLSIPNDKESPMSMQKGKTGFFALAEKDKTLWDRFRGTVIPVEHYGKTVEVERFTDKPVRSQIALAVRQLHFGSITGTSSKIVFFVACLFAMTFPITGVVMWVRKLAKRYTKRRSAKKTQEQPAQTVGIEHLREGENPPPVSAGQTV